MRAIKFRAWDGERMRDWGYGKYKQFTHFAGPPSESGAMDYPQMQYTGLKDKNGKEIYEGDILGGVFALPSKVILGEYGWETKFWIEGAWNVATMDRDYFDNYEPEIIGNIWENPGLLEKAGVGK